MQGALRGLHCSQRVASCLKLRPAQARLAAVQPCGGALRQSSACSSSSSSGAQRRMACAAPPGAAAGDAAPSTSAAAAAPDADPLVQWVVLRRDLWGALGWPLGPVIAQACHASAAALLMHADDEDTRAYTAPDALDHMHKVVLEVKGEAQLRTLAEKLTAAGIAHKLWVEQPEDFPTCLATKPYRRSVAGPHFKKLQLCKAALGGGGGGNGGGGSAAAGGGGGGGGPAS